MKQNSRNIILIIFLSLIIMLPFINQAYNIDDEIYLTAAVKFNKQGFSAINGKSEQMGMMIPNYYITHPLLWPLILSFFIKLINSTKEYFLHILSIINLIIIGISALSISKRFSSKPLETALLFLVSPAVVLMSHTVMTDIPTVAFFLLAVALHFKGIEKKSNAILILSGVAATISWCISYQALYFILLITFYNYLKKEKTIASYLSVIIPFSTFIFWFVFTWLKFGIPHPLISFMWADDLMTRGINNLLPKLIANINSLGAAVIFPFFILLFYAFKKKFRNILIISFVISLVTSFIFISDYYLIQRILFIVYFTTGFFLFLRTVIFLKEAIQYKDTNSIFLSVWFLSFFIAIAILMPLGISRYLLPGFLPIVIIFINDMRSINIFQKSKNFRHKSHYAFYFALVLTFMFSFLLSIADYQFANTYRDFAKNSKLKYKNDKVWFAGDSGFKWYMKKAGFNYLIFDESNPVKGDILVIPTEAWAEDVPNLKERFKLIDKINYNSSLPLRTLNIRSHSGFYAEVNALLPFSITRVPLETFYIYKMIK